jgi:hypothetical protein
MVSCGAAVVSLPIPRRALEAGPVVTFKGWPCGWPCGALDVRLRCA